MSPNPCNFIDPCVSNYDLEHVADPAYHVHEVFRVLLPGTFYCFRAPIHGRNNSGWSKPSLATAPRIPSSFIRWWLTNG